MERHPIVAPVTVKPSGPNRQVDGNFNAGVARVGVEKNTLVRVAESVAQAPVGEVHVPLLGRTEIAGAAPRVLSQR